MRVRELAPLGVEITEMQIAACGPARAAELAAVISRARVAVFRGQRADDAAFVGFLRLFGELTFTAGETPVEGAPDLNVISNVGRATPPRSVFHVDTSYVARPPAYAAMRVVRVPKIGGRTEFCDQARTAAELPARFRKLLEGRTVRHALNASGAPDTAARHPLFRRHPLTRETALFLSTPERCTGLSDADDATSARAIAALYRRGVRPGRLYAHAWRPGDIVVWDNRLTLHRADHRGVDGPRVLHRGLVAGEAPIPA